MSARMYYRLKAAGQSATTVVVGLIGSLLLFSALLGTVTLLSGVREFSWSPLSWGVPLGWNWDTISKAAVIGLLLWIVDLLRRIRSGQPFVVANMAPAHPYSNQYSQKFGTYHPAPHGSLMGDPNTMSPFDISRYRNFDPTADPELARNLVNTGAVNYMTASNQATTIKAAGLYDPDNN